MSRHLRATRARAGGATVRRWRCRIAPTLVGVLIPTLARAEWGASNWGEFEWGGLVPVPLLGPVGAGLLVGALVASTIGRRAARVDRLAGRHCGEVAHRASEEEAKE